MKTKREMEIAFQNDETAVEHNTHDLGWKIEYPFSEMAVGDFFEIFSEGEARKTRVALAFWYKKNNGERCYVIRTTLSEWVCRRYI